MVKKWIDSSYEDYRIPDVENLNPEEKKAMGYFVSVAQGIYSAYLRDAASVGVGASDNIHLNRQYGEGWVDVDKVKGWLVGEEKYPSSGVISQMTQRVEKTWQKKLMQGVDSLSWEPVSIAPKLKAAISRLVDIDYDISADPVDFMSRDEEMDRKSHAMVWKEYGDFIREFALSTGTPVEEPEFIPSSLEELEVYAENDGFKPAYCADIETLIKYTFEFSDYEDIHERHLNDLIDNGYIGMRVTRDPNSLRPYLEYIAPDDGGVQAVSNDDYKKSEYGWHYTLETVSSLLSYGVDKKLLKGVAQKYNGWHTNPKLSEEEFDDTTRWMNFKVSVMHFAFIDCDLEYRKTYVTKNGKKRVKPQVKDWGKVYDTPNLKTYTVKSRVAREGSWVVGTEICYNYGVISNQAREDDRDVRIPYIFFKLPYTSIMERIRPFIDDFYFGLKKLENAMVMAMNDGVAINVAMLTHLKTGEGKSVPWMDTIKFLRSMNVLPYFQSPTGKYEGGAINPVQKISGGIATAIQDYIGIMDHALRMIHEVTGINPFSMGANPTSQTQVTTAQMMMNATSDILRPMIRAGFKMKERSSEVLNLMIHTFCDDAGYMKKAYGGILSENSIRRISIAKHNGMRMGISLRVRPNDAEKQDILQAANTALEAGFIDMPMKIYITAQLMAGANLKRLALKLSYEIKKSKERQAYEQQQAIRAQSEGNIQHEQAKQQTMLMEKKLQAEMESSITKAKTEGELLVVKEKGKEERKTVITKILEQAMADEELRQQIINEIKESDGDIGQAAGQAAPQAEPAPMGGEAAAAGVL